MDNGHASQTTANACVYLLHMLLQRIESLQPGMTEDLLLGALADQAAFHQQQPQDPVVTATFTQAIAMLQRLHAQNQASAKLPET